MTLLSELRDRFGVEPVLRVLKIAPSTYYGWLAREATPGPREVEDRGLLSEISTSTTGPGRRMAARACTPPSPAGHPRRPQAGRAADARTRPAGRVPAQGLAGRVHEAEPEGRSGAGPGQPELHRRRPEPTVGGGRDPDRHRAGCVVARRGPRRVLQSDRGLEDLRPVQHRTEQG